MKLNSVQIELSQWLGLTYQHKLKRTGEIEAKGNLKSGSGINRKVNCKSNQTIEENVRLKPKRNNKEVKPSPELVIKIEKEREEKRRLENAVLKVQGKKREEKKKAVVMNPQDLPPTTRKPTKPRLITTKKKRVRKVIETSSSEDETKKRRKWSYLLFTFFYIEIAVQKVGGGVCNVQIRGIIGYVIDIGMQRD